MANPRKFSEKIALHNQKQAEETRAFEEIMKEVSTIGKAPIFSPQYHSGSLPNVSNIPFAGNHIDLQNALSNLHELKEGKPAYGMLGGGGRIGPVRDRRVHVDRPTPTSFKRFGVDTSPYPYLQTLQPPQNNEQAPWRRAASDSALHRSVMQPEIQKTKDGNFNDRQNFEPKRAHSPQLRPKSCEVPGLNSSSCSFDRLKSPTGVFASNDQAAGMSSGMAVGNTGSLPDLTNLHMNPSPLQTPIDAEDSPYNQTSQQFPRSQHIKRHNYSGPTLNKFQHQVQFDPNFSPLENRVQFQYYQQDPSSNLDKLGNAACSTASPTMSPTVSTVPAEFNSFPTTPLLPLSEAYMKQQQNSAAAALQQQLKQFTMQSFNTPSSSAAQLPIQSLFSQGQGLYGPNTIMGQYANPNLPNVIVTSTEEDVDRGGDFAKDIGSAIGGVESDLYSPDLKFDPLDLESLRMLSGTEPVTDSATEESLRMDRLGFSMK